MVWSVYTCIPSHGLKRSWHSCPRWVNTKNKNTQHAPSTKMECNYLYGLIERKNGNISKNLTKNGELQRYRYNYRYCWTLDFDTGLSDLDFHSRSQECKKTYVPSISLTFQSILMEFGILLKSVGLMNPILILSSPINIHWRELNLWDFI